MSETLLFRFLDALDVPYDADQMVKCYRQGVVASQIEPDFESVKLPYNWSALHKVCFYLGGMSNKKHAQFCADKVNALNNEFSKFLHLLDANYYNAN